MSLRDGPTDHPRPSRRSRRLAVVLALVCALSTVMSAGNAIATPAGAIATPAGPVDALRALVTDAMADMAVPGAVVVLRTPEGDHAEAFGTRRIGVHDPVTLGDHFRVGSNTKTMVGTVVLQLVQEGRLALSDPVSAYRPDVPGGEAITVAHLLDMRSGLFGYSELESFERVLDEDPGRIWHPEELLALGLAQPPYFPPGEGFHYSNTNTVLLGLIVEQLTGQRLGDVLRERIFGPLCLRDTLFPALDDATIPDPHPRGYLFGTNVSTLADPALPPEQQDAALDGTLLPSDVTDLDPSWAWAAGAAISTAGDLADYVEALVGGGLLGAELQQQRLDSLGAIDPDDPGSAAYGLALARFGPMIGHDGSLPGFQSFMGHDPATGTTLVVLTNLQAAPDGAQPANEIARLVIAQL